MQQLQHYEITRMLGEGAHGVVHLAYDTHLLRPVVIKRLRTDGGGPSPKQRERILREARLASSIDHPNVCAVFDIHDDDDDSYIVMQYVPGRPLSALLDDDRPSFSFALSIATQIAEGLCAAHEHGVVHGDLKPANVMITEGGLVKILDFGLARRQASQAQPSSGDAPPREATSSAPWGTVGYMAPELFVGRPPSATSDIFAAGVMFYELFSGAHPFWSPGVDPAIGIDRAMRFGQHRPILERHAEIPAGLSALVDAALDKTPADRFATAAELRDALLTLRETEGLDGASITGRMIAPPRPAPRRGRLWGRLATMVGSTPAAGTEVAVLPFEDADAAEASSATGFALANAVATRLARTPGVSVRASRSVLSMRSLPREPADAGRALGVSHVVTGSLTRALGPWTLTWQLIDVATDTVAAGDTLTVTDDDDASVPLALQAALTHSVAGALQGLRPVAGDRPTGARELPPELTEAYFDARATLAQFVLRSRQRRDLDAARQRLQSIAERAPDFAPVHAAIGISHLQVVENGFGTADDLQLAADALDRALALDASLLEARIARVHTLLALGEKEAARHAVHHLLTTEPGEFNVRLLAATLLRLDGLYDRALDELAVALTLNPGDAHMVYRQRARVFAHQDRLPEARVEVDKALELQPGHPLVRVTHGYLQLRDGDPEAAVATLERVVNDDPALQMAYPTLALARLRSGDAQGAHALITEQTCAAADCDGEIAYRLATFHAAAGDKDDALRWLLRAIYLGNENHPWMAANPAWATLMDDDDLSTTLQSLARRHARNRTLWRRLLR